MMKNASNFTLKKFWIFSASGVLDQESQDQDQNSTQIATFKLANLPAANSEELDNFQRRTWAWLYTMITGKSKKIVIAC